MIVILDSGVGGFDILSKIRILSPLQDILYYTDRNNFPFGNKTKEQIRQILEKAYEIFASKNVEKIIIACNTASIVSQECFGNQYKQIPIYYVFNEGLIKSFSEPILILCTTFTARYLATLNLPHQIIALPKLASLVESMFESKLASRITDHKKQTAPKNELERDNLQTIRHRKLIEEYIKLHCAPKHNTILYLCTHFPLIHKIFSEIFNETCGQLSRCNQTQKDMNEEITKSQSFHLKYLHQSYRYLNPANLLIDNIELSQATGRVEFFCSQMAAKYQAFQLQANVINGQMS